MMKSAYIVKEFGEYAQAQSFAYALLYDVIQKPNSNYIEICSDSNSLII